MSIKFPKLKSRSTRGNQEQSQQREREEVKMKQAYVYCRALEGSRIGVSPVPVRLEKGQVITRLKEATRPNHPFPCLDKKTITPYPLQQKAGDLPSGKVNQSDSKLGDTGSNWWWLLASLMKTGITWKPAYCKPQPSSPTLLQNARSRLIFLR